MPKHHDTFAAWMVKAVLDRVFGPEAEPAPVPPRVIVVAFGPPGPDGSPGPTQLAQEGQNMTQTIIGPNLKPSEKSVFSFTSFAIQNDDGSFDKPEALDGPPTVELAQGAGTYEWRGNPDGLSGRLLRMPGTPDEPYLVRVHGDADRTSGVRDLTLEISGQGVPADAPEPEAQFMNVAITAPEAFDPANEPA